MSKTRSKRLHPRRGKPADPFPLYREATLQRAAMLDRIADCELQAGHHGAAERLAHEAEALRMTGGDRLLRMVGGAR